MQNIHNVGVNFNGVSYNSYLITAKENILIDTVFEELFEELKDNIEKYCKISEITKIIINHTEKDRSGSIKKLLEINPKIEILGTSLAIANLKEMLNVEFSYKIVKFNEILSIDENNQLKFIITHNINWPDSMMTYHQNEKVLFSCDAFSNEEGTKKDYFYKYLFPYSEYVKNAMDLISNFETDKILCGSGNPISEIKNAISEYKAFCQNEKKDKKKVTIIFESKSGNCKELAQIAKEECPKEFSVELIDLEEDNNNALNSIYQSDAVVFGCYTEHRNIPQKTFEILAKINHFKISNQLFCAFGSYGWSGEAPNLIYSLLRARHFDTFEKPFRYIFTPDENTILEFRKYINEFFKKIDKQQIDY